MRYLILLSVGFAFLLLARYSSTKLGSPLAPSSVGFAFLLLAGISHASLGFCSCFVRRLSLSSACCSLS